MGYYTKIQPKVIVSATTLDCHKHNNVNTFPSNNWQLQIEGMVYTTYN